MNSCKDEVIREDGEKRVDEFGKKGGKDEV